MKRSLYFLPHKRQRPRRILLLSLCAFFLLFSALAPETLAVGKKPSARPLHIYWQKRQQLNPLATFDLTGTAVMKLCYRGLFRIDGEESLRSDLAASAEWSADKLEFTIALRRDESFSDTSSLDAGDAMASILARRSYLRQELSMRGSVQPESDETPELPLAPEGDAPEENGEEAVETVLSRREEEQYLQRLLPDPDGMAVLDKIQEVEKLPDGRLKIRLSEPDLRLPWVLTFPILPQESVSDLSMRIQPGIGNWRIEKDGENGQLRLRSQDSSFQRTVQIIPCGDEREAIRRFDAGEIDLLLLSPDSFGTMSLRLDLASLAQETERLRFFISGSSGDRPLSDAYTLNLFRLYSELWPQRSILKGENLLPFHKNDWRLLGSGSPSREEAIPDLEARLKAAFKDRELIIAGAEGPSSRAALDALDERMSPLGCHLNWQGLDGSWESAAAAGNYDLILATVRLSPPYQAESLAAYLASIAPDLAPRLPSRLDTELMPLGAVYAWDLDETGQNPALLLKTREALEAALFGSRYFCAGFETQGLIFSRNLRGALASSAASPYEGLESLEIWE